MAGLSGTVGLHYRTPSRLLVFRSPDGRDRLFRLALAARPDPEDGWGDWRTVDLVGLPGQPQAVKPGPEDPLALGYKVRVWAAIEMERAAADDGRRPVARTRLTC